MSLSRRIFSTALDPVLSVEAKSSTTFAPLRGEGRLPGKTPYEPALRYSPLRGNRPDVTLKVEILHRQGFDKPVDGCELRCLAEIKADLHKLGACERQWSVTRAIHS